jgi:hypothetical protein
MHAASLFDGLLTRGGLENFVANPVINFRSDSRKALLSTISIFLAGLLRT